MGFRDRMLDILGESGYAARFGPDYDPPVIAWRISLPNVKHPIYNPITGNATYCETTDVTGTKPCPCGDYIWEREPEEAT